MIDRPMITVGWHKGEIDFRVSGAAAELSFEDMQQLRAMLPVAISQLEQMLMIGVHERNPSCAARASLED